MEPHQTIFEIDRYDINVSELSELAQFVEPREPEDFLRSYLVTDNEILALS